MTQAALETRTLRKQFGALRVANDISFRLEPGARHALIGPNGAGKTTFVNLVTGAVPADGGEIRLGGEEITRLNQARRVKRGLVRTFQITALFRGLCVLENVAMAVSERMGTAWHMLRPAGSRRAVMEQSYALLERLGLSEDALRPVRELAYGRQRLVEIAVALALEPKVLLLDEPAAGVPSSETARIIDVVDSLPAEIALLIIEHDMDLVFRLARRITVLVRGSILVEGTPTEIAGNAEVRKIYLGEREVA
jgi:ABC-type branched-subunit amino acid transport system ATPase component